MTDRTRQVAALLAQASNIALHRLANSLEESELKSMYTQLPHDQEQRELQINFWQRFIRERSHEVRKLRDKNPSLAPIVALPVTEAQLLEECKLEDNLTPLCIHDVLCASTSTRYKSKLRLFRVLPPSWFRDPDEAQYRRLFGPSRLVERAASATGRFIKTGALALWNLLTDGLAAVRPSCDETATECYAPLKDGEAEGEALFSFAAKCTSALEVRGQFLLVTLETAKKFGGDLATAVSWLFHERLAEPVFYTSYGCSNAGLCLFSRGGSSCPPYAADVLAQIFTYEALAYDRARSAVQGARLSSEVRALMKLGTSKNTVAMWHQKRLSESMVQWMDERVEAMESVLRAIAGAESDERIACICAEAHCMQEEFGINIPADYKVLAQPYTEIDLTLGTPDMESSESGDEDEDVEDVVDDDDDGRGKFDFDYGLEQESEEEEPSKPEASKEQSDEEKDKDKDKDESSGEEEEEEQGAESD